MFRTGADVVRYARLAAMLSRLVVGAVGGSPGADRAWHLSSMPWD